MMMMVMMMMMIATTIIMVMMVLTDWFCMIETGSVYYAVRMLSVLIIQVKLFTTSTPGRSAEGQAATTNKMCISK